MKNETGKDNETENLSEKEKEFCRLIGRRLTFSCYWEVLHKEPRDEDVLVDSHDDLFILPDTKAESFQSDTWTWLSAIHCARKYNCTERNDDRRIEISGKLDRVRPNLLVLSDIEFAYRDDSQKETERTIKEAFVIDKNRLS